jgi:hypothetical protein
MNDEEIVKAITLNLAVRLSTANYAACKRWMDRRSVNASEPS